ncbi:MAG: SDR family NAD(P)-dependent oxidoreductase [Sedimentibacter sp.]
MKDYFDITECMKNIANTEKGITIILSETQEKFISYRDIWVKSYYFYQYLKDNGVKRQDVVAIYCDDIENIIYTLWTCAIGDFIAMPIAYGLERIFDDEFISNSQNPCVVTDNSLINEYAFKKIFDITKIHFSEKKFRDTYQLNQYSCEDLVCIQFSSGSTGKAKGIPITRKNLCANLKDEMKCFNVNENDIVVNWEPLTHSGGLIIFYYMSIAAGISQYIISPDIYVKNPLLWLKIINKTRATITGSVPFALKHFMNIYNNQQIDFDWDLSCIKIMTLGAEHVGVDLYRKFTESMKKYKFRPNAIVTTYGMSEATCLVAYGINDGNLEFYKLALKELSYGGEVVKSSGNSMKQEYILYSTIGDSTEVKIINEEGEELPNGTVGSICIKGPSIINGYFTKQGIIADANFQDGWFDSGDLGFLIEGRHLGIVGRVKDIVVIGGENFECSALENIIKASSTSSLLKDVIVCNVVDKSGIECIGAFILCPDFQKSSYFIKEFVKCKNIIRGKIFEEFGIFIDTIIPIKEIPRNESGKVKRLELGLKYNNGEFDEIMNKIENVKVKEIGKLEDSEIAFGIAQVIKDTFDINITDYNRPFQEYGIVSVNVPTLIGKVNEMFKINLKTTSVFNYPNVNSLAEYIHSVLSIQKAEKSNVFAQNDSSDSIAIVGMSCRFPQGGNSPEEFWNLLVHGVDAIGDVPEERWEVEKYFSADDKEEGKMYCKKGGFLNVPIDQFDPKFFNISPKEVAEIDPHHRILIELTWEAFENAGLDISKYSGSRTGVFLGLASDEYGMASVSSGNVSKIDSYSLTGICKSTACGRISYMFGFEGPSLSVDTACSSVLTALHLACSSIKNNDADVVVVGSSSLMLSPTIGIAFSKLQATSHDGHCKTFDATADGYGRGEGAGIIILRKLSEAVKDNDNILGVICSTGLNQDGNSNGLTAPKGESQKKIIEHTLKKSGICAEDVDYIEAHGTGTPLGDPIEVNAIIDAYCKERAKNHPLLIGSVKSNIGHLEAASGMASIIKVLLSFRHNMIPGDLHYSKPNPEIAWNDANVEVVDKNTKWDGEGRVRRAGINSFGFGGSNAHVIMEEYKKKDTSPVVETDSHDFQYVLKISGKTQESIKKLAKDYKDTIESHEDEYLTNILYTADRGRGDFNYRVAVTGGSKEELLDGMKALIDGKQAGNLFSSVTKQRKKVVFMFTGQGSQYVDMCRQLFDTNDTFKEAMLKCDGMFRPYILKSLIELIYGEQADSEVIEKTIYAQPLIFSIEYSLCRVWEKYGACPDMVIGHSIGEYAAAVEAGIFSLESAVELVSARGRLMDAAPGSGTMVTVFADIDCVNKLIGEYSDRVVVAVHNAQEVCVISGEKELVEKIRNKAENMGIRVRQLKVSHGFHSPLMKSAAEDFKALANRIEYHRPKIRFISCLYAREVYPDEILDASYWSDHIFNRVDFYNSMAYIENEQDVFMLEVGPTNSLGALCRLIYGNSRAFASSITRTTDDLRQMMDALAKLYVSGINIDWNKIIFDGVETWNRTNFLPNYPFERASYWKEIMYDRKEHAEVEYDNADLLLGQRIESICMDDTIIFQRKFNCNVPYFMSEHIIYKTAISPAAAYVSILISAMKEIRNPKSITIQNIELRSPLIVTENDERLVQICISHAWSTTCEYKIISKSLTDDNAEWEIHSQGTIKVNDSYVKNKKPFELEQWQKIEENLNEENIVYRAMVNAGFDLGIGFRRVTRSLCTDNTGICYIEPLKSIPYKEKYVIYPGVIDSIFHTMLSIILEAGYVSVEKENNWETMIPYFVSGISYNYLNSDKLWCNSNALFEHQSIIGDVDAFNESGDLIMQIDNMITKITTEKNLLNGIKNDFSKLYYHYDWAKYEPVAAKKADYDSIVLISDQKSDLENLKTYWQADGRKVRCVIAGGLTEQGWKELVSEESAQKKRVIFVYGCGAFKDTFEEKEESLKHVVNLAHAFSQLHVERTCSLCFVTVQANQYKNDNINLNQAMIWGFAKSFAMELTDSFHGILDIEETMSADDWKMAADEILYGDAHELCMRAGKFYISKLTKHSVYVKHNQVGLNKIEVTEDGTYLVIGGTGLLGMTYIKSLIDLGVKNIAVLCRKNPCKEVNDAIAEWNSQGVCVKVFCADVCKLESLTEAVDRIRIEMTEIKGVVNAAGVLRDKMIQDLSWEDYEFVLSPKVTGCVNLYKVLKQDKLDFFIMLSSITSVIGNVGQSNYAAANYFMNCFAAFLNQHKKNGFVFCWGPWEGTGMASDKTTLNNMEMMGISPISKMDGNRIICDFFANPYELLLVADINWNKFVRNASGSTVKELLSDLVSVEAQPEKETKSKASIMEQIETMDKQQVTELLTNEIKEICSNIMGYNDVSFIDGNNSFKELGADSLMIFSMRTEINQLLNVNINVAAFYNHPTIVTFSEYLVDEVLEITDSSENNKVEDQTPNHSADVDELLTELEELLK